MFAFLRTIEIKKLAPCKSRCAYMLWLEFYICKKFVLKIWLMGVFEVHLFLGLIFIENYSLTKIF